MSSIPCAQALSLRTRMLLTCVIWQLVVGMIKGHKIQILCATMWQTDFSKYREMHIYNCDAVFANQADTYNYVEKMMDGAKVEMLTTATKGVGKNRNLALTLATGDILLFADDDMEYTQNAVEIVAEAFKHFPKADMIVFGIRYAKNGVVFKSRLPKTGRLPFYRALRYGTCAIAVRREAVQRCNLHFTESFGGGCLYSYGEDTDFIVQCYKKHLHIYAWDEAIAVTNKDTSTCFSGYGKKYYFDKGALARHSLGIMALPYCLRIASKKMETELPFFQRIAYLWYGYKSFPQLISYERWVKTRHEEDSDS
ncbi:glycosyltransferase family 2 protein [Ruthenibacterium intestinale]